jgi:predicted permease
VSIRAAFHTVIARIQGFLRPGALEADFDAEMEAHLAAAEDDGVRRGLTREEARRMALVQLGGLAQLREASRAARGLPWVGTFWLDLKLGARLLFKYPGLTLVSTLALAIGIAIVAGFHAGTEFMVRPVLPHAQGERIVAIWNHDLAKSDRGGQTLGDMLALRRELTSVDDVGAFVLQERAVTATDGRARLVHTAQISASAFEMLRVAPVLGRALVENDEQPGAPPVALIGFELWQSALRSDPKIIGATIQVGGEAHTVVGVMPSGFAFPGREHLWTPLRIPGGSVEPGEGPAIEVSFGRLAPDVTLKEAEAQLQVIGSRLAADQRQTHATLRPRMAPYARSFLEAHEPGLATMMSAARMLIVIVVLIVAVNVGALVFARNATRVGEVALRMALGASRRRIAVQMFLEALVLASAAAVVGLAIMTWPLQLLRDVFATSLARGDAVPYWFVVRVGPETGMVVAGLVLLCAALTGILPALKLTNRHMRPRLQQVQPGVSGLRFGRATTAVVVSQVAISVALLTVAGAQLWTLVDDWRALEDGGRARAGYLSAQLRWDPTSLASAAADDAAAADAAAAQSVRHAQVWRALDRRLSQEPDVRGVTFDAFFSTRPFEVVSSNAASPQWAYVVFIAENYFSVQNTPVLAGRAFVAADAVDRRVAIVNEAFVRAIVPTADAVGQHVRPFDTRAARQPGTSLEIVGVVQDVPRFEISQQGPAWVAQPTVYLPLSPSPASIVRMTVHVRNDPQQFVPRLTAIAAGVDPTLVVHQPMPVEAIDPIDAIFLRLYGFGVSFLLFAVLLLATAGVYSMMSFTVAQRTREIGIRTALGANPARVVGDVFRRALLQVGVGTTSGLGIGFTLADGPFALSNGVFHDGPGLMVAIGGLILTTGAIACGIPLQRALRIQPTEALRADA